MEVTETVQTIDRWLFADGKRYHALDGLRFIAITLVILQHIYDRILLAIYGESIFSDKFYNLRIIAGVGWIGVQIFFVLSGFLIGDIIYKQFRKEEFSFKYFYINRSLRIFPAAWTFLFISSWYLIGFNKKTLYNFLYVTNYMGRSFESVLWSLNVEEHFYLFFPLIFFLLYKKLCNKPLILLTILFILVSFIWAGRLIYANFTGINENELWFITGQSHLHADFFLFGIIAAILCEHNFIPQNKWFSSATWLVFLCYVPLAIFTVRLKLCDVVSYIYPLIALWCFSLVILLKTQNNLLCKFLSKSLFRWIAVLSYSMYLYHIIIIKNIVRFIKSNVFINISFNNIYQNSPYITTLLAFLIVYSISVSFAIISFTFVERPFLLLRGLLNKSKCKMPTPSVRR